MIEEISEDESPSGLDEPFAGLGGEVPGVTDDTPSGAETAFHSTDDSAITEHQPPLSGFDPKGGFHLRPPRDLHKDRFNLTLTILTLTAAFTVAAVWISIVVNNDTWDRLQSQLGFFLTPFHTLLGIAIGFYFADRSRDKD